MQDEPDHQQPIAEASPKPRYLTGGVVSVAVHVAIIGALLVGLPESDPPQPKEEAVSVEIVPPPEKPPQPPPQPKAEEPPPPSPPPQQKPEPEKQAAPMQTPVLRPAFQFGEKDSGPEKSPDGDGADIAKAEPSPPVPPPVQQEAKPDDSVKEEPPPESKPVEEVAKSAEAQPEISLPEVNQPATVGQGEAEAVPAAQPEAKPLKPAVAAKPTPPAEAKTALREAKKLYSTSASGEMVAMMTLAGVPREQRASQLCATELREQLKHGKPRFEPEYLPNIQLSKGNVMQVDLAAFRSSGVWYDIRYRCEVDGDATRVTTFSFAVGDKVPRSQWAARRFPVH